MNNNYIAPIPTIISSSPTTAAPRRKKNNVFEQFTPEYISSPFDVDLSPAAAGGVGDNKNGRVDFTHDDHTKNGGSSNTKNKRGTRRNGSSSSSSVGGGGSSSKSSSHVDTNSIKNANKINLRLRSLLLNDEGEINPYLPDDSPEAAQQLAQFHTYSKVSEEARRKAKESVSSHAEDEDDDEGGEVVATTMSIHNLHDTTQRAAQQRQQQRRNDGKRRMSIRATVKETGSDSISSYTKSLGQHELLHKDDEVLLGRQVRMLMVLEEKRMELEEELLR
jgi:hypothetical protein